MITKKQDSEIALKHFPIPNEFSISVDSDVFEKVICVEINQKVLRGQPLVFRNHSIVPVHAPTSGWIQDISFYSNPFNNQKKNIKIIIISDFLDKWIRLKPIKNYKKYIPEKIIKIIHQLGIVGLGGGQFSSAKKLTLSMNKVNTLIVNAVESDPYITADHCLIHNHIDEVLEGCQIISWICNIRKVLISIQEDKIKTISKIYSLIKNKSLFKICVIKKKYPAGSSKILIKSITGKEVPYNKHSIDIGYLVFNVATIYAIKRAVINGEPLTERIITFSGDKNFLSGNFWTRFGTPIKYFLTHQNSKIFLDTTIRIGGFFMGKTIDNLNYSVLKNTNSIFVQLKKTKNIVEHICIRCGYCSHVCPVNLLPQQLYLYSKNSDHKNTQQHHILDCIECKACEKVCPSYIPLVEYFKNEKNVVKNIQFEENFKKISLLRFKTKERRLLSYKKSFNDIYIDDVNAIKIKDQKINKNTRKNRVKEAIERIKSKK